MTTLRFFELEYKGATDNSGSRIIVRDLRFGGYRILPARYNLSVYEQATEYLQEKDIVVMFRGETNKGYLLGTTNFDTEL